MPWYRSKPAKLILAIVGRILLLIPIAVISNALQDPFHDLLGRIGYFDEGFIGFSVWWLGISWALSWTFWGALIYTSLGRKYDYVFSCFLLLLAIWDLNGSRNIFQEVWISLFGVFAMGTFLGYFLRKIIGIFHHN